MAATGATTATLGHMLQAGSLPAHTCGGSQGPAVVELVSLRQQDFRPCDFQLAYCVGETPDVRCSEQDDELGSAATVDEEAGHSRSPELHEEASQSTHRDLQPLPKFVVVPPDFDGECWCNVRKMLPPPDNTAPADAMDVNQRFLEEWRRASEGPMCVWKPRVFLACVMMTVAVLGTFFVMAWGMNGASRTKPQ